MLAGVERRFGTDRAPHPIERLPDNGGRRTAKDARDLAQALGLVPCFTPVRSPESDGTSEAFVKTLWRECARVTPPPDTATVLGLGLVSAWIDDYNTAHPHAASARHSPREARAALNPSRTPGEMGGTPQTHFLDAVGVVAQPCLRGVHRGR